MGKKWNQYAKEYKVETVRLIAEEGRLISEGFLSLELLRIYCIVGKKFLRNEKIQPFPGKGFLSPEDEEFSMPAMSFKHY